MLEELLHEEESSTLDFKRDQYPFVGATDGQKAELLKDILAFANAWRRTDAHILIGVDEVRGGASTVVGVSEHLNDADLQQFVNSKVNRPITFSYTAVELHGAQIGVIKIPLQKRPFYLQRAYAGLGASVVYLRRGSSTAIATPDEVSEMGQDNQGLTARTPLLTAFFVAGKHDEVIEKHLSINVLNAKIPEKSDFPQYGLDFFHAGKGVKIAHMSPYTNHDFYFEYAQYFQKVQRIRAIKLSVKNEGNAVAKDVKLVLKFPATPIGLIVYHADNLPEKPAPDTLSKSLYRTHNIGKNDISVKTSTHGTTVTCNLGKIQAMDSAQTTDLLCVGSHSSMSVACTAEIFSDDLDAPITEQLELSVTVNEKAYSAEDFTKEN